MPFMKKNKRIALLSDALVVEETAMMGLLVENMKLLNAALPAGKREAPVKMMEHILRETLKHQRIFAGMLKKEAKA